MIFRSLQKYFVAFAFLFVASSAFAGSFVEFFIVDKTWPDHKWGHVSLHVKDGNDDVIFDFGRYGKMWGLFNTEGEPILRVWKNGNAEHMKYQKTGNTRIHTIRFAASSHQVQAVMNFYKRWIGNRKPFSREFTALYYNLGSPSFHSMHHNCTTLSIAGFSAGFPQYDVNRSDYAQGNGLYWWARSEAATMDYEQDFKRWSYIWWPNDLLTLLEQQYVRKDLAIERSY